MVTGLDLSISFVRNCSLGREWVSGVLGAVGTPVRSTGARLAVTGTPSGGVSWDGGGARLGVPWDRRRGQVSRQPAESSRRPAYICPGSLPSVCASQL